MTQTIHLFCTRMVHSMGWELWCHTWKMVQNTQLNLFSELWMWQRTSLSWTKKVLQQSLAWRSFRSVWQAGHHCDISQSPSDLVWWGEAGSCRNLSKDPEMGTCHKSLTTQCSTDLAKSTWMQIVSQGCHCVLQKLLILKTESWWLKSWKTVQCFQLRRSVSGLGTVLCWLMCMSVSCVSGLLMTKPLTLLLTVCRKMNWVFKMAACCGGAWVVIHKVINRWWASCLLHIQACRELVMSGDLGWTMIVRIWSVSVPPVNNTSMHVLLHCHVTPMGISRWSMEVNSCGLCWPLQRWNVFGGCLCFFQMGQSCHYEAVTIWKLREIFVQPGLPDMLVSDNGANFASEEFANFLRSSGIIHMKTDPHHLSSIELAERAGQLSPSLASENGGCIFHANFTFSVYTWTSLLFIFIAVLHRMPHFRGN